MDTLISFLSKLFCLNDDSNQRQKSESVFWSEMPRIPSASDSVAPRDSVRSSTYGGAPSVNLRGNRSHHSISSDFRPDLGSFHGARATQSSYHGSVSGTHLSGSGRSHRTGSYNLSASGLPALGSMSVRPGQRHYPHICEVANYF
jgi:hypothetical protein